MFYSPKPRSQVRILIYRNWSIFTKYLKREYRIGYSKLLESSEQVPKLGKPHEEAEFQSRLDKNVTTSDISILLSGLYSKKYQNAREVVQTHL